MPHPSQPRFAIAVLACALAALTLAACGSGSGSETDNASASAGAVADADRDAARVRLAQCLRENGLDVPDDPGAGRRQGNFRLRLGDRAKVEKAMQACRKHRDAAFGQVTQAQRQEFRDAFTKFSACMRRNGVDLPDPGTGPGPGGGAGERAARPRPGARRLRSDPDFEKAFEACRDQLPQGRRGGPGIMIRPGPRDG